MKLIIGLAALIFISSHTDPNPGHVDDPGAKTLIRNQIKDSGKDPRDFTIQYTDTSEMPDHQGGMNLYTVTQKSTGTKTMVVVAIHFGPIPDSSPSPTPSPTGFTLQI
jgi:hypothetical protein